MSAWDAGSNTAVRVAFACVRDESFSHSNGDVMNRYFRRGLAFESLVLRAASPLGPGAHLLLFSVTARSQLVHGPSVKCASHLHSSNFWGSSLTPECTFSFSCAAKHHPQIYSLGGGGGCEGGRRWRGIKPADVQSIASNPDICINRACDDTSFFSSLYFLTG